MVLAASSNILTSSQLCLQLQLIIDCLQLS